MAGSGDSGGRLAVAGFDHGHHCRSILADVTGMKLPAATALRTIFRSPAHCPVFGAVAAAKHRRER
jgi:hypothetical protein